jgi:hypothetical protein
VLNGPKWIPEVIFKGKVRNPFVREMAMVPLFHSKEEKFWGFLTVEPVDGKPSFSNRVTQKSQAEHRVARLLPGPHPIPPLP